MVSLRVDIQKKDLWLISAIFVFMVGVGFVIAGTWTDKPMFHNAADVKITTLDKSLEDAVVDGDFGGGGGFGAWTAKSYNTNYLAATDGLVVIYKSSGGAGLTFKTDGNNPPITVRARHPTDSSGDQSAQLTMPVRKGDYWRVEDSSSPTSIYWIPLGN